MLLNNKVSKSISPRTDDINRCITQTSAKEDKLEGFEGSEG